MKKIYLILTILFFISCQEENSENHNTSVETGTITGKVVSQNTEKNVGGALVFSFNDNDEIIYCYSDTNGNFNLEIPIGERQIYIQTGDGSNFRTTFNVNIIKNQTLNLPQNQTSLNQVANIAYISGNFDYIQSLINNLGYNATQIDLNDLADYEVISQYDIIFLNCGSRSFNPTLINLYPQIDTNLAKFVTNGGSLYASDWSLSYLVGGIANVTSCNMSGGFIPDNTICSTMTGLDGIINNVQIVNNDLLSFTGFSTLDIDYDIPEWQQIISYDSNYWDSLVETQTGEPLMLKTDIFYDSSLVTNPVGNDTNDEWVTICHIPPGNQNNPITITINQSALSAHLAHGDTLGSCDANSNGGTIYYTTFHNHASGNIGNSEAILNYVILNL